MKSDEVLEKIKVELKIQGKSEQTIKMYCYFNKDFLNFIKKDTEKIDEDDIKKYLAYILTGKNYNSASAALALSSLKFFYDEISKKKIVTGIKAPKRQRKIPEVPTKEEILKLINVARTLKTKILIEFMYASGLRVSEVANLKISDVNLEDKTGLLKKGKGNKDRFFILSERLIEDLKIFLKDRKTGYIFEGINDKPITIRAIQTAISRTAQKANLKKRIYCHLLRHAFATHLLEEGVDIRMIQELLAHSNLQTTQWYTQISKKKLKEVKSPLD